AVGALPARFAEGVGLAVHRGVAFLHAPVVASAEEPALAVEESRADGDAAFGQAAPGLFDRHGEHRRIVRRVLSRPAHQPGGPSMESTIRSTGMVTSSPAVPGASTRVTDTLSPSSSRSPFLSRLKARLASSRKSSPGEPTAGSSKEVMLPT